MKKLLSITLSVLTLVMVGLGLIPSEETKTYSDNNTVSQERVLESYETKVEEKPLVLPISDQEKVWVMSVLDKAGLPWPEGSKIYFTNVDNCGADSSTVGVGGCYNPIDKSIRISPSIVGTDSGAITLLHEYGHSTGLDDECLAEYFAHDHMDTDLWAYSECYYNR